VRGVRVGFQEKGVEQGVELEGVPLRCEHK